MSTAMGGRAARWRGVAAAMGMAVLWGCGSTLPGADGGTGGGVGGGTGGGGAGGGGGGIGGGGGANGCGAEPELLLTDGGAGSGPVIYEAYRTQSPLDAALVQHLKDIAARGQGNPRVFSKVGDSITASGTGVDQGQFLNCFDGKLEGAVSWEFNIHLAQHCALSPTIDYFKLPIPGATSDAWARGSLAAKVGQGAGWPLQPSPDAGPLAQELAAANPRYAVVMYGSNDIYYFGLPSYPVVDQLEPYEKNMRALTDTLLARGVIPLLTTIPPRVSSPEYLYYVPLFTGVVRAIAQGRQVPLIDYNKAMMAIGPASNYGLGGDGLHPNGNGYNTYCFLDDASVTTYGYNARNLVTLVALDRMRRVMTGAAAELDHGAPRQRGAGTQADPLLIPSVPYGELRDLAASTEQGATSSCAGAPAITGKRVVYQLTLARPTALRLLVLDRGARALRVSVWSGAGPDTCVASDASLVAKTFPAGTYRVAVEAPAPGGASEYNLSVTECAAGDPGCP